MASIWPGRRLRENARRSMSETYCAQLVTAAHRALGARSSMKSGLGNLLATAPDQFAPPSAAALPASSASPP